MARRQSRFERSSRRLASTRPTSASTATATSIFKSARTKRLRDRRALERAHEATKRFEVFGAHFFKSNAHGARSHPRDDAFHDVLALFDDQRDIERRPQAIDAVGAQAHAPDRKILRI